MRRTLPALLLLLAVRAGAQEHTVGQPFWVSAPAGARAALDSATAAVAAQDWPAAARALQEVFDRHADRFVPTASPGLYVGARQRAMELLLAMPAQVRAEHDRIFGPPAEEETRRALAAGDRGALFSVLRRYETTAAGLQATLALADSAILLGRPTEARLLLARLRRLRPELADSPAIRQREALAVARDEPDAGAPSGDSPRAASWPMLGGAPGRNRICGEPLFRGEEYAIALAIPERRWDRPPVPPRPFPSVRRSAVLHDEFEERWSHYAPVHPVIAEGHLVFHDGRQIVAVNLFTGEEKWRYPRRVTVVSEGRTGLVDLFTPVIAGGVVYASIEVPATFSPQFVTDVPITYYLPSRRLVAIDIESGRVLWSHENDRLSPEMGADLLSRINVSGAPLVRGDRIYAGASYTEGTFHTLLIAVDRSTGALLFSTPVSNGQQELNLFGRQLQENAPTPIAEADGVLYYGTNLGVVAAIDALLGCPLWATAYEVVQIPSTYFWYEAPRRWALAENSPAVVAGDLLLVAPTDGTRLLALERASGRLRWSHPYRGRDGLDSRPVTLLGADAGHAFITGDGVKAIWLQDDPARGRKAGTVAWPSTPFPDGEVVAGRGLIAHDSLWVPTLNRIFRIDRMTGKVLQQFPRGDTDGMATANLVWGEGVLALAGRDLEGRDFVVARYEPQEVLRLARERAQQSPEEVAPLLSLADLCLAAHELEPAIESYRAARRKAAAKALSGAEERARQGLFRALLAKAEHALQSAEASAPADFDAAVRAAPSEAARLSARERVEALLAERDRRGEREWRLRNLADLEREHGEAVREQDGRPVRAWALRRTAEALLAAGEPSRALEVLHRLLAFSPQGEEARFAAQAIESTLAQPEGARLYQPYESQAASLFAEAWRQEDLATVERGILLYPNARASAAATLELARRRISGGRPGDAIQSLQRFLADRPKAPEAPAALLLLAEALHVRSSFGPALAAIQMLRDRHGDAMLPRADGARVPAREIAEEWLRRPPYPDLVQNARRRELQPPLVPAFTCVAGEEEIIDVPELLGPRPAALGDAVLLKVGNRIQAIEGRGGALRWSLDFGDSDPIGPLVFSGGRLFILTRGRIHLFDAVSGRAFVAQPVPQAGLGRRLLEHNGLVFLLYQAQQGSPRSALCALDPADGATLWTTELPVDRPDEVYEEQLTAALGEHLLLFSENPVRVTLVNVTSGSVENRIPVHESRTAALSPAPLLLPDGRLLLGVSVMERSGGFNYDHFSEVLLLDPERAGEAARLWRWQSPGEGASRKIASLVAYGDYAVALDDARSATVLDLRERRVLREAARLPVLDRPDDRARLCDDQPVHDALFLMLTRSVPGREGSPPHLSAFEMPDLRRRFSVPITANSNDLVTVIDSRGVLGIAVTPGDRGRMAPRVLLLDPLTGKALQDIRPENAESGWFTASVQNGYLVLIAAGNVAFGFGPK